MAVNDLIAQGVRPMQIESPLNMMAKMQALREAEQQNQMFQQKQQDYLREQQLQNALRGRLSGGGVNIDNAHELLQYGGPGRQVYESILKGDKERAEAKNLNSQVGARTSENAKREVETLDKYLSTFRSFVPTVRDADGVASYVKAMYAHPVLGPMAAQMRPMDQALQANLDLFTKDPRQWQISNAGLTGDKLVELMKGTRQNTDLGGANVGRTINAFGEVVPGSEVSTPTTVSPDAKLRSQDAAAARAQSAAQHADNQKAPTVTDIVDPADPNRMIRVDARRYAPGTTLGAPGVLGVAGKEPTAAVRENKIEKGKTEVANVIDELRAAYQNLDKKRAIPSTQRGTVSNIGSAIAATGVGQVAGRFTGSEAQVDRDVIQSSRIRLLNAIKQSTGMSAQQLNSNVELQTWLKAVTDPGQSIQAVDSILDSLERSYAGTGAPKAAPSRKASGTVTTETPAATKSGATVSNW